MATQFRIILVDDHPMLRQGVAQLLSLEDDFLIVGQASSGDEGIPLIIKEKPDLVLLDLNMKGMSGIETLQAIKRIDSHIKVAIFTVSDASSDLLQAIRQGGEGYLLKDSEPEALIDSIKRIVAGEIVVSTPLVGLLAKALSPNRDNDDPLQQLTQRELDVLGRIAEGNSNKAIARYFDIAESTVKVHVKNILRKLNLKSRVEAAVWMLDHRS